MGDFTYYKSHMNPNAANFVPMNPSKTSKNNKNKNKMLAALAALSMTVADKVLQPDLPFELHKELAKRLEDQIIKIPTITSVDGLEQVAQISTYYGVYELFWNGTHAILDNRTSSWQFPDMTIRHILECYFGNFTTDSLSIDVPVSYAPAIQLSLVLYQD